MLAAKSNMCVRQELCGTTPDVRNFSGLSLSPGENRALPFCRADVHLQWSCNNDNAWLMKKKQECSSELGKEGKKIKGEREVSDFFWHSCALNIEWIYFPEEDFPLHLQFKASSKFHCFPWQFFNLCGFSSSAFEMLCGCQTVEFCLFSSPK